MDKLNNSVKIKDVDPNDFVALFVPGGHGEMALLAPTSMHRSCTGQGYFWKLMTAGTADSLSELSPNMQKQREWLRPHLVAKYLHSDVAKEQMYSMCDNSYISKHGSLP